MENLEQKLKHLPKYELSYSLWHKIEPKLHKKPVHYKTAGLIFALSIACVAVFLFFPSKQTQKPSMYEYTGDSMYSLADYRESIAVRNGELII